jgi:hypothetical protein
LLFLCSVGAGSDTGFDSLLWSWATFLHRWTGSLRWHFRGHQGFPSCISIQIHDLIYHRGIIVPELCVNRLSTFSTNSNNKTESKSGAIQMNLQIFSSRLQSPGLRAQEPMFLSMFLRFLCFVRAGIDTGFDYLLCSLCYLSSADGGGRWIGRRYNFLSLVGSKAIKHSATTSSSTVLVRLVTIHSII